MSTTLVKPAEVERKWYLLDAAGKSLGHSFPQPHPLFLLSAVSPLLLYYIRFEAKLFPDRKSVV